VYSLIGKMLILGMPKVMKALGWIGVVAMLMVGGGILLHNLPFLHELNHLGVSLPSVLPIFMEYFVTPITIALSIGAGILAFKRLLTSKHN
jgi:predicted DNA repair protein MutK